MLRINMLVSKETRGARFWYLNRKAKKKAENRTEIVRQKKNNCVEKRFRKTLKYYQEMA